MWILIWKIWLSPVDVITEWEGNNPKRTFEECMAFGQTKANAFNRVTYRCQYYTPKQFEAIVKEIRKRQQH